MKDTSLMGTLSTVPTTYSCVQIYCSIQDSQLDPSGVLYLEVPLYICMFVDCVNHLTWSCVKYVRSLSVFAGVCQSRAVALRGTDACFSRPCSHCVKSAVALGSCAFASWSSCPISLRPGSTRASFSTSER